MRPHHTFGRHGLRWVLVLFISTTSCDDTTTETQPDVGDDVLDLDDSATDIETDPDEDASDIDDLVSGDLQDAAEDVETDSSDLLDVPNEDDEPPTPACEEGPVPVVTPPGLFWDGDLAALRSRIEQPHLDAVWASVQSYAQQTIPDALTAPSLYERGNIAKAAALVGLVEEDADMLERALQLVEALPQTMDGVLLRGTDDDIHVADALVGHAVALHLLRSTELDTSSAESALVGLADAFFEYFSFYDLWWGYLPNNHTSKSAASLGLVALVVPEAEQSSTWLRYAAAHLAYLYENWLIGVEGAYAEGPYYNRYASITTTPFVIALHRALDGDDGLCGLAICAFRQYDPNCVDGAEWAPDLLTMPIFEANLDWTVAFVRPDGTLPPYDDSNPSGYPAGPIAGPAGHSGMAWMFEQWGYTGSTGNLAVELLLTWDDTLEAHQPESLEVWLPEAGTAVRRSGWGPNDRYVFLLAEPSEMQAAGHEHADALSLTVFDRGSPRLIDCGYSQWSDHEAVYGAEQHNTVFVDGQGPPLPRLLAWDNLPAQLASRTEDTWVAETTLPRGHVTRAVRFVSDGTVEVTDHVAFSEPGSHTLTARWHSLGGLTPEEDDRGVFEPTAHGGRWTSGGVATVVDAPDAAASHDLQYDGIRWATLRQHRCVIVGVQGEDEATLVTRIWVGDAAAQPPW